MIKDSFWIDLTRADPVRWMTDQEKVAKVDNLRDDFLAILMKTNLRTGDTLTLTYKLTVEM